MSGTPEAFRSVGSSDALRHLRDALVRNGTRPPREGSEVHLAIRELARQAREQTTPVEQVIVHLKTEWQALGLVARDGPRSDGAMIVERLVSLLLDEYFGRD